jgi:hypothetical protein
MGVVMRKLLGRLLAALLLAGTSAAVVIATPAPAFAEDRCARHDHTPHERVYLCTGINFASMGGTTVPGVGAAAWMYTNTSTPNVQIYEIKLYRVGAAVPISTCTGDLGCPRNGQNGYIEAFTDVHGPCRDGQAYYAVANGKVRWSDGTLSRMYEVKSLSEAALPECA